MILKIDISMSFKKPKYYFDTNIFLNFLLNEKNFFGKNIGTRAYNSFLNSISCKFHIIISSWTLFELKKKVSHNEIKNLMSLLEPKVITIRHTKDDVKEAKGECPDHYEDYLHLILARKSEADAIITRDVGFREYEDLIKIKLPEQIS